MNIAYLVNQRMPTEKAFGVQIAAMAKAFVALGHTVDLVVPTRLSHLTDDIGAYYHLPETVRIVRLSAPDSATGGARGRVLFYVKQMISSVILAWHGAHAYRDGYIFTRDESVAFFCRLFDARRVTLELHSYSGKREMLYRLLRYSGVRIVCITHALATRLMNIGYQREHISIAPDGFDAEAFSDLPAKEEARRLVHVPPDMPVIMYSGHLYPWKGVDTLAQAAPRVDGIVVFVGGTDADIARMKARYGTTPNIMFVGHRSHAEIPVWLRAADVLVLPNTAKEDISRLYTSPLKLFEYMASGVPIVASDLPSIREIAGDGTVLFIEPDDPEKLAAGIRQCIQNGAESRVRAERALRDVTKYSWVTRAESIAAFMRM